MRGIPLTRITVGITLFFIVISVYSFFQFRTFLGGPQLVVNTPINDTLQYSPLLTIDGFAEHFSSLTLNGRKIFVDEKGFFSEELLLSPGYTIITLQAIDRFGRENTKELEVVHNQ